MTICEEGNKNSKNQLWLEHFEHTAENIPVITPANVDDGGWAVTGTNSRRCL